MFLPFVSWLLVIFYLFLIHSEIDYFLPVLEIHIDIKPSFSFLNNDSVSKNKKETREVLPESPNKQSLSTKYREDWVGKDCQCSSSSSLKDTFHQTRLLKTPPNQAWKASRNGLSTTALTCCSASQPTE